MPQMMPMLWMMIFLTSLIVFFSLYMMINFYKIYYFNQKKSHLLKTKNWNWKW